MNRIFIIILSLLFLTLFVQCSKKTDTPTVSSPTTVFNTVWSDFDKTYPYFLHKKIDWDSVQQVYYSQITEDMSNADLADVIGEMTMVLKDIHVTFNSNYENYHYRKRELYPENPPANANNYLSNLTINNSVATYGDISNSNLSYLRIKTFIGSSGNYQQVASQLDSLINKDGLIIDIRENKGGNELYGRTIAGKFTEKETLYKYTRTRNGPKWNDFTGWNLSYFPPNNAIPFDKNIILLTNRGVYSSAELFVLMMKTFPNLIIVGDTTGGASANPARKILDNDWRYYISTWQSAGLDYSLLEDNGIAPDHYVLMDSISIAEGKDLILEKAIELFDAN